MPKTKEQYDAIKSESKARIMEAGLRLFIKKGLLSTSVSEIAATAGISKGLMYHYYKSKEELYSELVGIAIDTSDEYMKGFLTTDISPGEKIRAISRAMLNNILRNEDTAEYFVFINRAMMAEVIPDKTREHFEKAFDPVVIMEQIIEEGQKSGEFKEGNPRAMSILFWSAVNGICSYKLMMGEKFVFPNPKLLEGIIVK